MDPITVALVCLLAPLAAFAVQSLAGERLPRQGDWLPTSVMGLCALLAGDLFLRGVLGAPLGIATEVWSRPWFQVGTWRFDFGIAVDNLTATMLFVVSLVSFLVHLYSTAYMRDHHGHAEPRYAKYFAYLALFTFSMMLIIVTDSLFLLFCGWELVGVSSYLLIGFYLARPSAARASMKAFVVNKIGDFGFFVGLALVLSQTGALDLGTLFRSVQAGYVTTPGHGAEAVWTEGLLMAAALCLFCGAVGKSAQFPLHVWLPDAMEGPTPVSALIHAATMVAAGVYMVARLFPVFAGPGYFVGDTFSSPALWVVAGVGAVTAILAATIALVQSDLKKALAYSTVSQLGYMVVGLGVGSMTAGMFHLFTHAWFKACLFLGAGSVHHAVETYEMPLMGGLRKKMPVTFATYLVATCAIAGVPFLAGFWSKEAIIGSAIAFGTFHGSLAAYLPALAVVGVAGLTAFYMMRTLFLTFMGEARDPQRHAHAHEQPWAMTLPLATLAVLAVLAGGVTQDGSRWLERRVGREVTVEQYLAVKAGRVWTAPEHLVAPAAHGAGGGAEHAAVGKAAARFEAALHAAHGPTLVLSLAMGALGIGLAWLVFLGPWRGEDLVGKAGALASYRNVLLDLYSIDAFYKAVIVPMVLGLSRLLGAIDKVVVDGLVNLAGHVGRIVAKIAGSLDYWAVDGAVRGLARATAAGGDEARRVQTGRVQEYVYLSLVLTGFIVFVWIGAGMLMGARGS